MEQNTNKKPLFEYEDRLVVEINDDTQIELRSVSDENLWPYNKIGINNAHLRKFNIYPIAGIIRNGQCVRTATRNNPLYGIFTTTKHVKVYIPRPSKDSRKFMQYGKKTDNFIFGWEQLPENGRICVVNAGEKDAQIMSEVVGYPSISPNSENSYGNITDEHFRELKERFRFICVMFDNDETGRKYSKKICNRYNLINIKLPNMEKGKDLADYVEKGMPIQEIRDLIECKIEEPEPIWDNDTIVSVTTPQESTTKLISKDPKQIDTFDNFVSDDSINRILLDAATKEYQFESGQRNSYIKYVSSASNTRGIKLEALLERLEKEINLSAYPDHLETAKGIYERYKDSFGSHPFKEPDVFQKHETPVINADVYEKMPLVLKNFLSRFNDDRERDVAAWGFLSLLGAILKGYSVIHKNQRYYTNLFVIVAAPFASGKGVLNVIRNIGNKLHKRLLAISAQRYRQYKSDLEAYKKGEISEEPEEPILPRLFLPGDMSAAGCKEQLYNSGGMGMMFDTEADTISSTLSMEWGDYSVLLRKGLSNEGIEFVRKNVSREIEKPFLSGLISGTIGALLRLIPNSENGLFSRLIYYTFYKKPKFAPDAFDYKLVNQNDEQEKELAELVEDVYFYFEDLEEKKLKIDFFWEESYQEKLITIFKDWLNSHIAIIGEDGSRVLFRLANLASRIAAILTIFRLMEKNEDVNPRNLDFLFEKKENVMVTCIESDFEITCHLMDIIRQHTMHLFENLQKESENKPLKALKTQQLDFWYILPQEFQRKEAVSIGGAKGVMPRTVDKYLKIFYDQKLVEKDEKGNYTKLK